MHGDSRNAHRIQHGEGVSTSGVRCAQFNSHAARGIPDHRVHQPKKLGDPPLTPSLPSPYFQRERRPYEADELVAATAHLWLQRDVMWTRHSHAYRDQNFVVVC